MKYLILLAIYVLVFVEVKTVIRAIREHWGHR